MKIQFLVDNPESWIVPYISSWISSRESFNNQVSLLHKHEDVETGDILVLLSCEKKFKLLHLNKFNLVVHESALPKGRGMSPLTWQVLEGSSEIPVTLLEATDQIDAGVIYGQTVIRLCGTELVQELRELQAKATFDLLEDFIKKYPDIIGKMQIGEPTFYPRRTQANSQLDVNETIANQFNLLRVVDNERYPAWFEINGSKYEIKIFKKST